MIAHTFLETTLIELWVEIVQCRPVVGIIDMQLKVIYPDDWTLSGSKS